MEEIFSVGGSNSFSHTFQDPPELRAGIWAMRSSDSKQDANTQIKSENLFFFFFSVEKKNK